jgi:hypothetical protein
MNNKPRANNVAEEYSGMSTVSLRVVAYKTAAQDCWWVQRFLTGNQPLPKSIPYHNKRRHSETFS